MQLPPLKHFVKPIWCGLFCIVAGVGPLIIADLLRPEFNTIGFGTMWGLSFGPALVGLGILILALVGLKRAWDILFPGR